MLNILKSFCVNKIKNEKKLKSVETFLFINCLLKKNQYEFIHLFLRFSFIGYDLFLIYFNQLRSFKVSVISISHIYGNFMNTPN